MKGLAAQPRLSGLKPMLLKFCSLVLGILLSVPAQADIVSSDKTHFHLRHEAVAPGSPDAVWDRLIKPKDWWLPDHTYSGASDNLSLAPEAGGQWREDWAAGSVEHGRVLSVLPGKMLRLDAPFGPLQGQAVTVVWTITLTPHVSGGTLVQFEEMASGFVPGGLGQFAGPVDRVKAMALDSLVRP